MKRQWILWLFVILIVIGVLFVFNYQGNKDFMPLSDIFPESKGKQNPSMEYVFMDKQPVKKPEAPPVISPSPVQNTVKNTVSTLPPPIEEKPETQVDYASAAFTIQVASFREEKYAQSALARLISAGFPGRIVTKDLGDKGVWYRLYVGAFQNKNEAQAYLEKLKEKYSDSLIITLK